MRHTDFNIIETILEENPNDDIRTLLKYLHIVKQQGGISSSIWNKIYTNIITDLTRKILTKDHKKALLRYIISSVLPAADHQKVASMFAKFLIEYYGAHLALVIAQKAGYDTYDTNQFDAYEYLKNISLLNDNRLSAITDMSEFIGRGELSEFLVILYKNLFSLDQIIKSLEYIATLKLHSSSIFTREEIMAVILSQLYDRISESVLDQCVAQYRKRKGMDNSMKEKENPMTEGSAKNTKKSAFLLRKKNESFDGFRDIESVEDILELLSPDTRWKFQQLDDQTQDYYLSKLSQRVDWDTEDAEVIEDTLVDIMRFESFNRRRRTKKQVTEGSDVRDSHGLKGYQSDVDYKRALDIANNRNAIDLVNDVLIDIIWDSLTSKEVYDIFMDRNGVDLTEFLMDNCPEAFLKG